MSATEDPYEILSLPRSATQSQVKAAYRKLALKYHPDKQTSADEKRRCGDIFTKIGSAYEILGDQQRRTEYDRSGNVRVNEQQQQQQQQQQHRHSHQDPFFSDVFAGGSPFMSTDPFSSGRGRHSNMDSRRGGYTDPFDIFRQVFGGDFGDDRFGFTDFHDHSQTQPRDEDFVEQQQGARGGHRDPFGGGFGGGRSGFGMMGGIPQQMGMMNSMMGMQSSFSNQQQGQAYSSSSSSFQSGGGAMSESVSTTTRIVNGRRQTVTERTVMKPDGTVETTTETSGDDVNPSSSNDQGRGRFLEGNRGSSHW